MRFDTIWLDARLATLAPAARARASSSAARSPRKDGRIAFAGPDGGPAGAAGTRTERVALDGRWITPGLIDCHTHLVYAGDRAHEFELRLAGASYEEIARAGGGIVSTVKATRAASEDELVAASAAAARRAARRGRHDDRDQVRLRARSARPRSQMLRAARRLARERDVRVVTSFLGAHALPPEADGRQGALHRRGLRDDPGHRRRQARRCGRRLLRGHRLLARADRARVRGRARRRGCRSSCTPTSSPTCTARGSPPSTARCRPIISNTPTRTASPRWRAPARSRCCCRARSTSCARSKLPPVEALRRPSRADRDRDRLQSRHVAAHLAAPDHEHGGDAVPPDGRGGIAGVTREAARALGRLDEIGTLEPGKCCDLAIWDIERPAELVYRIGFNPLHARVWRGA